MIELIFNSLEQQNIFFLLINNPKGLILPIISKRLDIPKTTCYNNIEKLNNRFIDNIPYIKYYKKKLNHVGRPNTIYFIPKGILNKLISIEANYIIK